MYFYIDTSCWEKVPFGAMVQGKYFCAMGVPPMRTDNKSVSQCPISCSEGAEATSRGWSVA